MYVCVCALGSKGAASAAVTRVRVKKYTLNHLMSLDANEFTGTNNI